MLTNLKLSVIVLAVCSALTACDKISFSPLPDQNDPIDDSINNSSVTYNALIVGDLIIKQLTGSLTNLVSENFETNGRNYYAHHLKIEKLYPGHVVFSNGSEGFFALSYSINIKFYSGPEDGPVDEEYSVVFLDDPEQYYVAMDKSFSVEKKAIAYLLGDRSFDAGLNPKEYENYLMSQHRIKSASFHLKKTGKLFTISFNGETETGEKVNCIFKDTISFYEDNMLESKDQDFSLTEPSGNYIEKGGKYYKLNDGTYFVFSPSSYGGKPIQPVQVIAQREYYWYTKYHQIEGYSEITNYHFKSNAVFLQFQFSSLNQFQAKTYLVAPSDGIHSMGYGLGALRNIPFDGFPNDSHLIGYYHIALDSPSTFTYNEDPVYMSNQIALKSGQIEIINHTSEYLFTGSFIDTYGDEVRIKFKAIAHTW